MIGPQLLDVLKFRKRCDPIRDNSWSLDYPITQNNIKIAIANNNLLPPKSNDIVPYSINPLIHAARIAWFIIHGWNDPINIDVGVPSLGCYPKWPLKDGNHRFAAAIIRDDHFILANMSGAVNEIQKFLWETVEIGMK